jgi:endoglucanase
MKIRRATRALTWLFSGLLCALATSSVPAAELIFQDGFNDFTPRPIRGTNIGGMEMFYADYPQTTGPVAGMNYPIHDTRLIDYFAGKRMTTVRFLFSWEAMQPTLLGPIPGATNGNYKAYFDHYKRIVDYATNVRQVQVIVEPWDANSSGGAGGARYRGDVVGSAAVPNAAFADFWSKMAVTFAGNPRVSFGLINEPNDMSTMAWWSAAQAAVTAIRATGSSQRIFVPGNGYSAASTWTNNFYDTAAVKRSNAYGWLNANGVGQPLNDPLNNSVAEVHTYLDPDEGGGSTQISSITAARQHLAVTVNEARLRGYKVYLGELGLYAAEANASAAWQDFIAYNAANTDTLVGYTWWAAGAPGWWDDVAANGGGHFSITPTNGATFTGDTVNMDMIENDF